MPLLKGPKNPLKCRTMVAGSIQGLKYPERGADYPPYSSNEFANWQELHLRLPFVPA